MSAKDALTPDIVTVRRKAFEALGTIKPASESRLAEYGHPTQRTMAGRDLPAYYLVYFLLVELLDFENLGRFEKVAWCIPVELQEHVFLIEHRKMGLGVFASDASSHENLAREVVEGINRATKVAQPFFDWKAAQAVAQSKVNVLNRSRLLFERFEYLSRTYRARAQDNLAHNRWSSQKTYNGM